MERLLTDREVADCLRMNIATVRRLRRSGALPFVRLPGSRLIRVRAEDVDALIDRATQPESA